MERSDVLIVGGGPGGSSAAWRLQAAGLNVTVLDKKRFPRDKVCAGWVTPAVVDALALDTEAYRGKGYVFQPITGFITAMIGGPATHIAYHHTMSYGIRRCEFDNFLLERAGARVVAGEALTGLEREGDQWVVNGRYRAPMLIGAGGHFCPVARHLGAKLGSGEAVVAAQEIEFPMTPEQAVACNVAPNAPELYFCRDLRGYGWCFRKGEYLNIGLGREDNHRISDQVADFCDFLKDEGRIPRDIPTRFKGHAYLLYKAPPPRKLFDDGVMLVGDAAGLAYPQSGEGIRPAVESGLLAAETIIAAEGDFSKSRLAAYEKRLTERLGKRPAANGGAPWIPEAVRAAVAKRLLGNGWFSRKVVLDQWFLHVDLPPLRLA